MEWIQENWVFNFFTALFIGMHFFGFGCGSHGKHGGHEGHDEYQHSDQGSSKQKGRSSCH